MKSMAIALFVMATFAINVIIADPIRSKGTCPGGKSNGDQFNEGRYWYECKDGQVMPKGCLDEKDNRVDIDATYDTTNYRMQCVKGDDGFLTLIYKACMSNGAEHDVGDQWDDGSAFYTCVKEGNNLRVITLGCVDQGKQMKLDERMAKGDFIYQCRKNSDGKPTMNKVGCVYNGKKYNIGETFENAKYWYTCTEKGAEVDGCMYQGHRLQNGDHFTKDDMMFACSVTGEGTKLEPFACLQREENGANIERKVGCFWVEGTGSEAYEYTCKSDNSQVAKVKTQCVYRGQQGIFKVQPGCISMAGDIAVGCIDNGDGKIQLKTYAADQIDNVPGLKKCN